MTKKSIHWGILGLGKMAGKFAADLNEVPDAKVQAVASRDEARAEAFAQQFGATKAYADYTALCADPTVDIVYVATPHSLHFAHAKLALEAGKAVLVEKPMTLSAAETQALVDLAQRKKLFLMEAMWTRFIPATERLLEILQSGQIGYIVRLTADFGFRPAFKAEHRLFNPQLGGGALLDIGIYPLYLSLLCLGTAQGFSVDYHLGPTGVDLSSTIKLNYRSGAEAKLFSSFEEQTPTEALIEGTQGWLKVHSRFHHSAKLTLSLAGYEEEISLPFKGSGYVHEIEEVQRCLRNGELESPKHPGSASVQLARELERIRKAFS